MVDSGRRSVDGIRHALEGDPAPSRHAPIRTCIGCRQRHEATELLRVVVAQGAAGIAGEPAPVVPDPRRRAPGRGAWVHPVVECVETAQRRRAFARALRVPGPVDPAAVLEFVAGRSGSTPPAEDRRR